MRTTRRDQNSSDPFGGLPEDLGDFLRRAAVAVQDDQHRNDFIASIIRGHNDKWLRVLRLRPKGLPCFFSGFANDVQRFLELRVGLHRTERLPFLGRSNVPIALRCAQIQALYRVLGIILRRVRECQHVIQVWVVRCEPAQLDTMHDHLGEVFLFKSLRESSLNRIDF